MSLILQRWSIPVFSPHLSQDSGFRWQRRLEELREIGELLGPQALRDRAVTSSSVSGLRSTPRSPGVLLHHWTFLFFANLVGVMWNFNIVLKVVTRGADVYRFVWCRLLSLWCTDDYVYSLAHWSHFQTLWRVRTQGLASTSSLISQEPVQHVSNCAAQASVFRATTGHSVPAGCLGGDEEVQSENQSHFWNSLRGHTGLWSTSRTQQGHCSRSSPCRRRSLEDAYKKPRTVWKVFV